MGVLIIFFWLYGWGLLCMCLVRFVCLMVVRFGSGWVVMFVLI